MGFHWYVLRTRPSCENVAATELDRGGFDVFNPRASILRAKQGSRIVPLFPGYLFVRFDGDRDFPSILRFTGVSGWVKFGGEVPAVPDEVIDEHLGSLDGDLAAVVAVREIFPCSEQGLGVHFSARVDGIKGGLFVAT